MIYEILLLLLLLDINERTKPHVQINYNRYLDYSRVFLHTPISANTFLYS